MSAKTEQLLKEISDIEAELAAEPKNSRNTVALREMLAARQRELTKANEALTEGRQVLKG